jgi:hypothetical protein
MSELKNTGYQQMECTDMHHQKKSMVSDTGAGFVNLQVVGTDPHVSGVKTGASITNLTGDYSPPAGHKNPDQTFMICIETEGIFFVTLFDGSDFIITAVQAAAYLGQWYPAKIYSVNVGTTGDFSIGY